MVKETGLRRALPILGMTILLLTTGWATADEAFGPSADLGGELSAEDIEEEADGGSVSADGDASTDGEDTHVSTDPKADAPDAEAPSAPLPEGTQADTPNAPGVDADVATPDVPTTPGIAGELQDRAQRSAQRTADSAAGSLPSHLIDLELAVSEGVVLDPAILPLIDGSFLDIGPVHAEASFEATVSLVKSTRSTIEAMTLSLHGAEPSGGSPAGPTALHEPASASPVLLGSSSDASNEASPRTMDDPPFNPGAPEPQTGHDATVQSRFATAPDMLVRGGATTTLAAAALTLIPYLAWVLYHRIRGHAVLNNATRKAIYDAVCQEPGLGVKELANVADVSYSTASYHLDRLRDADMVVANRDGNRLSFYQNGGAFTEAERQLLPLLQNDEAMRVLEDILDNPGTYRARIAERLGVTATTINWHLKGLVEAGLVEERREGRTAHLYVPRDRLEQDVLPLLEKEPCDKMDWASPVVKIKASLGNTAPA